MDLFPPKAYILGAPKCGTTALAQYLSEHPRIAFSRPKEPHFFSDDLSGLRAFATEESYEARFRPDASTRLLMEGSVWYLYSRTAVSSILRARPDAIFVVMLRHPVKMLASLHRQLYNTLDEDEPDFAAAWRLSDQRARGESIPRACRAPSTLIYTRTAAFGEMLSRLYQLVDRERCLILFQEELEADTAHVYRRTLDFLGIEDDGRSTFPRVNEASRRRSRSLHYLVGRGRAMREIVSQPLKKAIGAKSLGLLKSMKKWNMAKVAPVPVPPKLAAQIARQYETDMIRLCELLGRDLHADFGWPVTPSRVA